MICLLHKSVRIKFYVCTILIRVHCYAIVSFYFIELLYLYHIEPFNPVISNDIFAMNMALVADRR